MTPDPNAVYREYLAAWNESDSTRIRALLLTCVSEDVVFADPSQRVVGREALAQWIERTHAEFGGASYVQMSRVDGGHDNRYRVRWEVRIGDKLLIEGMDFSTLNEQGLLCRIDGFFNDFLPL